MENMNSVIATINGKEITNEDFVSFVNDLPQEQKMYLAQPGAEDYFKEEMLALYLYEAYADEMGFDKEEEFIKRMVQARRNVLSQYAMEKVIAEVEITEDEKLAFFEANKTRFAKGPQANAKHILMDDEEAILKVKEEIESGAKAFEDAAKECSSCPSSQKGGDLGTFGRGQMVKEFDEAVFTGEVGKVLGPVKTQFGYHLIKIESRTEGVEANYEEVKDKIANELKGRKQQEAYTNKLIELRTKYQK